MIFTFVETIFALQANVFQDLQDRIGVAFSCHVSSVLLSLEHFHCLSLSFMTLTFLKNIVTSSIIEHSSFWAFLIFLIVRCSSCILGHNPT